MRADVTRPRDQSKYRLHGNIPQGFQNPAVALAGWMNRQRQDVIAYLREENRILREKLGHKRLILNESQKRRLAIAAIKLGKDLLRQFGTLFSPDTLIRWNRWFVARKYDSSDRRGKRGPVPTKANMIRKLGISRGQSAGLQRHGRRASVQVSFLWTYSSLQGESLPADGAVVIRPHGPQPKSTIPLRWSHVSSTGKNAPSRAREWGLDTVRMAPQGLGMP